MLIKLFGLVKTEESDKWNNNYLSEFFITKLQNLPFHISFSA